MFFVWPFYQFMAVDVLAFLRIMKIVAKNIIM